MRTPPFARVIGLSGSSLGLFLLGATACDQPPAPPPPPPPAKTTAQAAPPPPPPVEKPAPPPPEAPAQVFFPVATVVDADLDLVAFGPASATIVAKSFVARVQNATIKQDPAWLTGLPQSINTEGIRLHAHRFASLPGDGQAFPLDYRVGTVKMEGSQPTGAFQAKAPFGFSPVSATAKPKAIAGVPASLDATGEHAYPAPGGGQLVVRTGNGRVTIFRVDAQEKLRSTETIPLPDGTTSLSVLRFVDGEILAQGNNGGVFSIKDQTLEGITGPQSLPIMRAALTEDGTLWVITQALPAPKTAAGVFARNADGTWSKKALPSDAVPTKLWAGGNRVWLATTKAEGATELWSTQPVKAVASFGSSEIPWQIRQPSVLPVSSDTPMGPGTSACSRPVVWLGEGEDKGVIAAVAADAEAKKHPLVLAAGKPKTTPSGIKITAPKQASGGLVLLPPTFEDGQAAAKSIAPALAKLGGKITPPRVLCGVVNEKKKIAPK